MTGRVHYQDTATASKGNAFCWLSWEPLINWTGNTATQAMTDRWSAIMEEKRRAGIDPSNFRGISTKALERDPARFAVEVVRNARRGA